MPKINLPELQALAEYVTGKVPRYGMFSTLKGLIDNSPKQQATAQEWAGYLKPGQVASRAGIDFPLKKEELEYSKIPQWLAGFKPNEMLTRDQVLGQYMAEAPELNVQLRSDQATRGFTREQEALHNLPSNYFDSISQAEASRRVEAGSPLHAQYSHAERGASPDNAASPYGNQFYQEDVTTSPDFGRFDSHFSPQDISWNRTNRLPVAGQDLEGQDLNNPGIKMMRVIDEIQSDRHQKAIKAGGWNPTPENLSRMQDLANDIMQNPPQGLNRPLNRQRMVDILRYGPEASNFPEIGNDSRWQQLQQLRESSRGKVGYQTPEDSNRLEQIEADPLYQRPNEALSRAQRITFDDEGNPIYQEDQAVRSRLRALQNEHARLSKGVPDTPFKTTQGYAGLEMRKALADALHSGDQSLALATGDDQSAFYGRRFSADQTQGQNYNYNTSYPSVLKDLARKYGLDYKPSDVMLKTKSQENENWPPRRMQLFLGVGPGADVNLDHYFNSVADRRLRGHFDEHDALNSYEKLWNNLTETMPEGHLRDLFMQHQDIGADEIGPNLGEQFQNTLHEARGYADQLQNNDLLSKRSNHPQVYDDWMRSKEKQNLDFNFNQSLNELGDMIKPVYESYKDVFGPGSVQSDPYRQKTFQNAIDLSDTAKVEQAKAAGVPVWKSGGSVDEEFDHVGHAMHRLGRAGGGAVNPGGEVLTDMDTSEPVEDLQSSLAKLSHYLNFSPDVQRVGTGIAKQFYGLDKDNNVVLGGRAWTKDQGGTPMGLLDQIAAAPKGIAGIFNTLKNSVEGSAGDYLGIPHDISTGVIPDLPTPQWSEDASNRLEQLDKRVAGATGVKPGHNLRENAEDMAGMMVTPIPMTGAVKEANAARRALEFLAPVRPPLRRLPVDAAVLGGINTAAQAAEGHADGGQPEQPPQPDAPTEDSLLNDMLQRRILMRQSAPPVPQPPTLQPQMGEGGAISERLAAILQKLLGENPDMQEHVAEVQKRNWAANADPGHLFNQVAESNPQMKAVADEVQRRNWANIGHPEDETGTYPDGGPVEPANKLHNPTWTEIYRRIGLMNNPTLVGKPDPTIPAYHPSDAAQAEAQKQAQMIQSMMRQPMDEGAFGPMMNKMMPLDSDTIDVIRAKLMQLQNQVASRPSNLEKQSVMGDDTEE